MISVEVDNMTWHLVKSSKEWEELRRTRYSSLGYNYPSLIPQQYPCFVYVHLDSSENDCPEFIYLGELTEALDVLTQAVYVS